MEGSYIPHDAHDAHTPLLSDPFASGYVPAPGSQYGDGDEDGLSNSDLGLAVGLAVGERATEEILDLRERISTYEADVRALRAQVQAQRQLLDLFQAEALDAAAPQSTGQSVSRQCHEAPLLIAAERGDAEMVKVLITEGAADARVHGDAALLVAAQGGHIGVARALLETGAANVHVDLDSPLLWASKRGDADMTGLLIAHGADPTALRACAMRLAIAGGHADVVRVLAAATRERRTGAAPALAPVSRAPCGSSGGPP